MRPVPVYGQAEQIQTIDKDWVIRRIGHLDARDISGIEVWFKYI